MFLFPTQLKFWIAPAIMAILSIVGYLFEPNASDLFAYHRIEVASLQIWRLVTGHLLHTNAAHLGLNLAGFGLLWALHGEYYTPKRFITFFLLCSMLTSIGIYIFSPQTSGYVGLSGVLHGLFVWGACFDILNKERTGWLLLIGIAIKLGYEQLGGDTQAIAELIGASVAVDAHLYGAVNGLILGLVFIVLSAQKSAPDATV